MPNISTVIVDVKIMHGNNLHLSVAHMKRVFVALAGVGAKAAGDSPQVGAEAAVGAKAAVGVLAAADEGAFNMDVDEDASRDNADQFLKTHIVPWLNLLLLLCQNSARAVRSLCRPSRRKFHGCHV